MKSRYILCGIMFVLEDHKRHTMQEIADRLEICKGTVWRCVSDLSLFYPITTRHGYHGGVQLLPKRKPDVLTDEEIETTIGILKKFSSETTAIIISKIRKMKKGLGDERKP